MLKRFNAVLLLGLETGEVQYLKSRALHDAETSYHSTSVSRVEVGQWPHLNTMQIVTFGE